MDQHEAEPCREGRCSTPLVGIGASKSEIPGEHRMWPLPEKSPVRYTQLSIKGPRN